MIGDRTEVQPQDEGRPGSWRLEVTPDGMEAAVVVSPAVAVRRRVRDVSASPELQVEEEVITRSPVTADELRAALARAGVRYGIDEDALGRAEQFVEEGRYPVARGKPPVLPEDARVDFFFPLEEKVPVSYGEGAVDLRLRFTFTSVGPGDLLARRHPPVPGEAGITVRGETVPPGQPRDLKLVAGKGAEVSADGQEVRATSRGRPMAVRKGDRVQVYVVSELTHPRDVDLSTGHVHFKGDVKVGGSILEGMEVMALGTVEVGGNVVRATVVGGAGVKVGRGIVSSTVVAGQRPGWMSVLLPLLGGVVDQLGKLLAALAELLKSGAVLPGAALRLLLETRFPQLAAMVGRLLEACQEIPARERDPELVATVTALKKVLAAPLGAQEPGLVAGLWRQLQERQVEMEGASQGSALLMCSYAVNSTLQATGDILVSGEGCHTSRLVAGGSVRVERAFRGGEIQAGQEVWVGTLGAPGVPARVRVPASGRVRLLRAAEDSVVQVGDRVYRLLRDEEKVGLRLDSAGELEFFW